MSRQQRGGALRRWSFLKIQLRPQVCLIYLKKHFMTRVKQNFLYLRRAQHTSLYHSNRYPRLLQVIWPWCTVMGFLGSPETEFAFNDT